MSKIHLTLVQKCKRNMINETLLWKPCWKKDKLFCSTGIFGTPLYTYTVHHVLWFIKIKTMVGDTSSFLKMFNATQLKQHLPNNEISIVDHLFNWLLPLFLCLRIRTFNAQGKDVFWIVFKVLQQYWIAIQNRFPSTLICHHSPTSWRTVTLVRFVLLYSF